MQKIKDFMISINFTILVLLMIGTRITICGASIGDALALIAVCGLQGFAKLLESKKSEPINEQLARELNDIKTTVSGLLIKQTVKPGSSPINPEIKRFF